MSYRAVLEFDGFELYHPAGEWSHLAESGALVPLMGTPHMMWRFCRQSLQDLESKHVDGLVVHIKATFQDEWPKVLKSNYGISDPDPASWDIPAGLILEVCDFWLEGYSKEQHWAVLAFMLLELASGQWKSPKLPDRLIAEGWQRDCAGNVLAVHEGDSVEGAEVVSPLGRLTNFASTIAFLAEGEQAFWPITDEPTMRLHNVLHLASEAWSCVTLLQGQVDGKALARELMHKSRSKGGKKGARTRREIEWGPALETTKRAAQRFIKSGAGRRGLAKKVADATGASRRTVSDHINKLEKNGEIEFGD